VPKLGVVTASVREGRVGEPVSEWFVNVARKHGGFDVTPIDLKAQQLPLLQEPVHPRLQQYKDERTKAWSALVAAQDAFVFVSPEYNFSSPPALVNALDHLYNEWNYKAAGFVTYGGVSGGLRAVQMTKTIVSALKMVPIVEAVTVSFVAQFLDKETGAFNATEAHEKAARTMLDELVRWTGALAQLRAPKPAPNA
jgi:NAD(P)H-dependent FMN reductase